MRTLALFCVCALFLGSVRSECSAEIRRPASYGGLYKTDGEAGVDIVAYARYDSATMKVCEMGLRGAAGERVTHCITDDLCVPGDSVVVDFGLPYDMDVPFASVSWASHGVGHINGNYEEYRRYWQACAENDMIDCGDAPSTWSWLAAHQDFHFNFKDSEYIKAINWEGFPAELPPTDIAAACENDPPRALAAPAGYYSERDCVPLMGRHWAEDKFENLDTFANQPALIYGTYGGESLFWEPMIAHNVFDWVRDNAPGKQATISWRQPELYPTTGYFPTHYSLREVTETENLIRSGRTVEISFVSFVAREGYEDANGAEKVVAAWSSLVLAILGLLVFL